MCLNVFTYTGIQEGGAGLSRLKDTIDMIFRIVRKQDLHCRQWTLTNIHRILIGNDHQTLFGRYLNKNWRFRLEMSMESMSITSMFPKPLRARSLSSSHPRPPAPTHKILTSSRRKGRSSSDGSNPGPVTVADLVNRQSRSFHLSASSIEIKNKNFKNEVSYCCKSQVLIKCCEALAFRMLRYR